MGTTTFSGPILVGKEEDNAVFETVLAKTVSFDKSTVPALICKVPIGSRLVDIVVSCIGTFGPIAIGNVSGGSQYCTSRVISSAGTTNTLFFGLSTTASVILPEWRSNSTGEIWGVCSSTGAVVAEITVLYNPPVSES